MIDTILLILILIAILIPESKRPEVVQKIAKLLFISLLVIGISMLAFTAVWNYNVRNTQSEAPPSLKAFPDPDEQHSALIHPDSTELTNHPQIP